VCTVVEESNFFTPESPGEQYEKKQISRFIFTPYSDLFFTSTK